MRKRDKILVTSNLDKTVYTIHHKSGNKTFFRVVSEEELAKTRNPHREYIV
jgi:hypothetical protein